LVTAADFRTLVLVAVGELQQIAIERRAKVEEFQRKHRAGLLTLLFTDIVDSTKLKQTFRDREAVIVIQRHHAVIREILGNFSEGEEIETAGDSFFIVFTKPSDAVKFSLLVQARLRALSTEVSRPVFDRIGGTCRCFSRFFCNSNHHHARRPNDPQKVLRIFHGPDPQR
jgi:class 3 adenylate cyclase